MARAKKKASIEKQISKQVAFNPHVWINTLVSILLVSAAITIVWSMRLAENYVRVNIVQETDRELNLVLAGAPKWLNDSLTEQIINQAKVGLECFTAEAEVAGIVERNINSRLVWLDDVRVKSSNKNITIYASYKEPAMLLKYKSTPFYLSTDMTVLDYMPIETLNIPLVTGVVLTAKPSPGDPLFHEQLEATVKLIKLFRAMDSYRDKKFLSTVTEIDVSMFGITEKQKPQIVIKTKDGIDVFWGAAPGQAEAYFEQPEKKKLAVLYTIFESHSSLVGRYKEIDLRYEQ